MAKYPTLSKYVLAGAAISASLGMSGAEVAARELQMSYFIGQRHPMVKAVVVPFQEKLAELSGGKLTIKVHFGGSLVKGGPPQYGALQQGVADIVFGLPGFTGPVFPMSNTVTIPGFTKNGEDATEKLWNAIDAVKTEYNAKIIALWGNDAKMLLTKKPIANLADVKGMKIRVTSKQDERFINMLGIVAVAQPIGVVHQNMSNGVIDGVHIGPSAIRSFKLHEPTEYVTTNLPSSVSALYVLMNKRVYEGLSSAERGWVDAASGRKLSLGGGRGYDKAALGGVKVAKENGVKVMALSDAEKARWQAAMQPEIDKFLNSKMDMSSSISKLDITGQQFVDMMNGK